MTDSTMTEQEIEKLARRSLDQSVESLDAATLSRLNQARQKAVAAGSESFFRRAWLPLGAAGFAMLALAVALPLLNPADKSGVAEMPSVMEDSYISAAQDEALLADLDLMLWLVDAAAQDEALLEDLDLMLLLVDAEDYAS